MLLQTIHSIKFVRLETNLSREYLNNQYVRKQEYFNTQGPADISKYRTNNDQSSLRSSARIIDLSLTSVSFSYPDTTLYINEGNGLHLNPPRVMLLLLGSLREYSSYTPLLLKGTNREGQSHEEEPADIKSRDNIPWS